MRPLIDRVAAYRRAEHNERPSLWFVQSIEPETWNKESEEKRNGKKVETTLRDARLSARAGSPESRVQSLVTELRFLRVP